MKQILTQNFQLPWTNAEGEDISQNITGIPNFQFSSLKDFFSNSIVNYVFVAAGIGLLLMIISSGFTLLTSAGDAKKVESGKQRLTYALAGFLIIFVSYWLVQILGKILGFRPIETIFR